jgi:outer membrane lipoprotein SlyB
MRRLLVVLMCLVLLAATAMPGFARTRHRHHRTAYSSQYAGQRRVYYSYSGKRTFWQKHRDKLTTAIGAGTGAILGGAIGGRRGAAIGTLAGGGGAALYTYKIRKRNRRY